MHATTAELTARRNAVLGVGAQLFYDEPVHLVRGEGVHLFDADGTRYLDLYNNVPCVGHAHPQVTEAVARQAATLNLHSRYLHEGVIDYAERLVALHHPELERVVFACTGTEANEVALAMARFATGRRGIICTDSAYHGNTDLVGRLTFAGGRSDPEIRPVRFPQTYRPVEEGLSDTELGDRYLADVEEAIAALDARGVGVAAMLVCPLFANEGLPTVPSGYLTRAAELVRAAGGLLIADEVQAGFCRSGRWWGYQVRDTTPDIATMGKPMGNGVPVSGVVARADLVDTFRRNSAYFNTFAASPLQAAAGSAVLDVIEADDLATRAVEVGDHLRAGLAEIDCPAIGDIRGVGQFTGVDWVTDREAKTPDVEGVTRVVNRLRDNGVLTSSAGAHFNVLKLRPPLVFDHAHADEFLDRFASTIAELYP